jgi:hypothetical protein
MLYILTVTHQYKKVNTLTFLFGRKESSFLLEKRKEEQKKTGERLTAR